VTILRSKRSSFPMDFHWPELTESTSNVPVTLDCMQLLSANMATSIIIPE
jgi:hypothetical protein